MGIKLVRVRHKPSRDVYWGVQEDDLVRTFGTGAESLAGVLARESYLQKQDGKSLKLDEVEYLSPATSPCQLICQGKNYLDHMLETGVKPKNKGFNLLFAKASSALAPAVGEAKKPRRVALFDYEIELALVIRKPITTAVEVTSENIYEFVAGIVMANDLSARDVQVPERQWFKGKSFRGFCPVGPWIWLWTKEEARHLHDLDLRLSVNGEVRQKSNTKLLLHSPEATLTEISGIMDLYPGDLVLTGTPGGVAMKVRTKTLFEEILGAFKGDKEKFGEFIEEQKRSPKYLKAGDLIESTIRSSDGAINLGEQRLRVTEDHGA